MQSILNGKQVDWSTILKDNLIIELQWIWIEQRNTYQSIIESMLDVNISLLIGQIWRVIIKELRKNELKKKT